MDKLYSIAKTTFVQTVRQPIFSILIAVTFAVLIISVSLAGWTMGGGVGEFAQSDKMMLISVGLATLLVAGLLIAAFSASSAVSREIEERTALTVISKPVARAVFVLGKFLGVAAAVTVAFWLCAVVYLMTVRQGILSTASDKPDMPVILIGTGTFLLALFVAVAGNYFFSWSFTATIVYAAAVLMTIGLCVIGFVGKQWQIVPFAQDWPVQMFIALLLMYLAVLVLVAVAVAASTRLGQVMTLLVCIAFFFVGTVHEVLFEKAQGVPVAGVLAKLAPYLPPFYQIDALMQEKAIAPDFVAYVVLYAVLYIAALLALGIGLFQGRQLESTAGGQNVPSAVALLGWTGRIIAAGGLLAGLIYLSLPRNYTHLLGWAVGCGILAMSVAVWAIMASFGRGAVWAYWIVLLLSLAGLGLAVAVLLVPSMRPGEAGPIGLVAAVAVAAGIVAVLILPKTRRHFTS